jgi:N-acetyl-D-muramate 6-phosphate phosphatase
LKPESGFNLRAGAVLFDLDGTLLDTAPDMTAALNELRREHLLGPLPFETLRPQVSHGARALVRLGFESTDDAVLAALCDRFRALYRERLAIETRLYEGVRESLDRLESAGVPWGIVTNKPGWLTDPLLQQFALHRGASVIVSGDTLPERKPHPAPLLHAARVLGVAPARCLYIGDAERDVLAARAADMEVFVALYGYIPPEEQPLSWPATGWLESPQAMAELLASLRP